MTFPVKPKIPINKLFCVLVLDNLEAFQRLKE